MRRLLQRDAFGNGLKTWNSVDELEQSSFSGMVGFRGLRPEMKLGALPNIPASIVRQCVEKYKLKNFIIQEGAPDYYQILQGELWRTSAQGLYFRHVRSRLKMREALALNTVVHAFGLYAKMILQNVLTPSSYDEIMDVLDLYDGIVELTIFSKCVGWAKHRNHVTWEVRHY